MSDIIPPGWEEKELNEVINIQKGKKPKIFYEEYQENLIPYLDIKCFEKNIVSNYANTDNMVIYDNNKNHILIVCDGARSGLVGRYHGVGIVCSTTALIITKINKYFIEYYLISKYLFLNKNTKGTGIPHLNINMLLKLKILVPPLEEQQAIVSKIESEFEKIDLAIAKLENTLELLEKYKQSILKYAFDENSPFAKGNDYIPYEWEEKKLQDIAQITSSKRVYKSDYVDSGIPFYRGKEITLLKNNKKIEDVYYISHEKYEELRNKYGVPSIGDVLITAVGTIGNAYTITNDSHFYFKDGNILWIKNIKENSKYIELLFDNEKEYILSHSKGSAQFAFTIEKLEKLVFKFPNLKLQETIAKNIQEYFKNNDKLKNIAIENIQKLKQLKQTILKKAFSGELI